MERVQDKLGPPEVEDLLDQMDNGNHGCLLDLMKLKADSYISGCPHPPNCERHSSLRVGALGHILDDDQCGEFRAAKALVEDPVDGTEGVLRLERIKELLFRG
jgi:hypothetical protein